MIFLIQAHDLCAWTSSAGEGTKYFFLRLQGLTCTHIAPGAPVVDLGCHKLLRLLLRLQAQ